MNITSSFLKFFGWHAEAASGTVPANSSSDGLPPASGRVAKLYESLGKAFSIIPGFGNKPGKALADRDVEMLPISPKLGTTSPEERVGSLMSRAEALRELPSAQGKLDSNYAMNALRVLSREYQNQTATPASQRKMMDAFLARIEEQPEWKTALLEAHRDSPHDFDGKSYFDENVFAKEVSDKYDFEKVNKDLAKIDPADYREKAAELLRAPPAGWAGQTLDNATVTIKAYSGNDTLTTEGVISALKHMAEKCKAEGYTDAVQKWVVSDVLAQVEQRPEWKEALFAAYDDNPDFFEQNAFAKAIFADVSKAIDANEIEEARRLFGKQSSTKKLEDEINKS
ncbi:MAG: hypothetical protein ACOYJQ_07190 [Pseudochelatococcus sp.]|jgi:hypothetical protein|uniref:hypothetical protein n=1 Tax=Pseudochelatococcus sp. TaxID=2020869 RepID=UPI003D918AB3